MLIFRHIKKDGSKREKKEKVHYTNPKLLLLLPSHLHRLPHMHHQPLVFQPKNKAGSRMRGRRRRRYRYHVVYCEVFHCALEVLRSALLYRYTYSEGLSYRRPVGYRKRRRGGESRRSIGRSHVNITSIVTWFSEQLLLLLSSSSSLRNSCVRKKSYAT